MALANIPGPLLLNADQSDIDDGTLARVASPTPGPTGSSGVSPSSSPSAATGDCAYLNPRTSGTVRAPEAAFTRLRGNNSAARISEPQQIASHRWPDRSSSAAIEQEIQIGGQRIRLFRPTDADAAGKNHPTTTQVAEALRAIPSDQRSHTTTVMLSPNPHPDSTLRRTIAGDAGSGVINLYPLSRAQSQNDFDNRLMHESGHNYQGSLWRSGSDVAEWGSAASRDDRSPSPYAREGMGEDFCEFHILYNAAKGTRCEPSARELYPNRWEKMESYQ